MLKLPEIDFSKCSFLSAEAIEFHFGRHHKAYIDNFNKLAKSKKIDFLCVLKGSERGALFNNAAQAFNHTFYWMGIASAKSKLDEKTNLYKSVVFSFGNLENLENLFSESCLELFGSGWTWLVLNLESKRIEIINTANAEVVFFEKYRPLLICDVWEHAYYIDYRNSRENYVRDFMAAVNWKFVSDNFENENILKIIETMS